MKTLNLLLLTALTACYACKERHKVTTTASNPDYEKGLSFLQLNRDSAFFYFNKVATSTKDSIYIALSYHQMARIQSNAGDYYGSQESLLNSNRHLDERREYDQRCLLSNYSLLGTTYLNLKNYDAALDYANRSLKLAKDSLHRTIALNNKALAYQKKKQYDQAITIYQSIIDSSKNNKKEYARVLSNITTARWLRDPVFMAAPDLLLALQIRREINDSLGLNASYAHLSDYYTNSYPDSALIYAQKMSATAQHLDSPDDELEALQKLITLSPLKTIKQYFIRYEYLNDSIQTARNNAKNQFALIRYDAEKSKADNLLLQKDNADKKVQIIWGRIALAGIIILAVITFIWYRKRKQRMLHEQQLKTSKKVHDVVANGLYHVMTEIEHGSTIDKELLLDKIEGLYEQSRDISYEQPESLRHEFQDEIAQLLMPFATSSTRVFIVGNNKNLWNNVKGSIKKELKHVLQELMVNMKKHSNASSVVVKFEQQDNHLKVQYTDDGNGLPPTFNYGNGLTNTVSRIKDIGGRIIFDNHIPKGLKIEVSLPIAKI